LAAPLPTLIAVRERDLLELLDLTILVFRSRPGPLLLAAAAGTIPFALLNGFLVNDWESPGTRAFQHTALAIFESPLATAPLTVTLGNLMFGQPLSPARVLVPILKSLPALVLFQVILRGLLLMTFVFSPLIPARLMFLNEVILLERGKWRKALKRSSDLCDGVGGELFGRTLLAILFGAAFIFAFSAGMAMVQGAIVREALISPFGRSFELSWSYLLGLWAAIAFFAAARFLSYIDQRTRREGWELGLRLRLVARSLREREAW
jgi:hypothetical protein